MIIILKKISNIYEIDKACLEILFFFYNFYVLKGFKKSVQIYCRCCIVKSRYNIKYLLLSYKVYLYILLCA